MQRGKRCITNILIRVTRKEKPLSSTKIHNPSKNLSLKYTKMTKKHKIAISIDNMIKKLTNIREL